MGPLGLNTSRGLVAKPLGGARPDRCLRGVPGFDPRREDLYPAGCWAKARHQRSPARGSLTGKRPHVYLILVHFSSTLFMGKSWALGETVMMKPMCARLRNQTRGIRRARGRAFWWTQSRDVVYLWSAFCLATQKTRCGPTIDQQ